MFYIMHIKPSKFFVLSSSTVVLLLLQLYYYLYGSHRRGDPLPVLVVHDSLDDLIAEPSDDPGQHVEVAVGADDVEEVVALVVGQVADQGGVQPVQGGALRELKRRKKQASY